MPRKKPDGRKEDNKKPNENSMSAQMRATAKELCRECKEMPIEADICLYKAAGKGTEPQTDILNKGFLIKVPFKRLAGTKSAPPRARRACLVPAADGRAGGPCAFTAMIR